MVKKCPKHVYVVCESGFVLSFPGTKILRSLVVWLKLEIWLKWVNWKVLSICVCWTIKLHNLLSTLHILWNQNRTAPHHVTLGADGLGLQLCSAPNFPALWTNPWTWSAARVDSVGKQEASILDQVGGWAIWFEVNLTKMFLVFCYCMCTIITHS